MAERSDRNKKLDQEQDEFLERVIRIDRTRKTVKGGRISSSRVCAVVGDGRGSVGFGMGKALSATDGIQKALERARKTMVRIPLDGYTIPHEVQAEVGGAVILLRPASRGTGIIAGGAVRQIIEVSGIRDVLTKSLGSGNVMNRAKACFKALQLLRDPAEVAARRGKTVKEIVGRDVQDAYADQNAEATRAAATVPIHLADDDDSDDSDD
ncbi:MAG: 30S ribosomal protein S5 [Armatimonadetes bacterium]|nr:30S ribosomal protein S5 [Armatimonadota bacterium]